MRTQLAPAMLLLAAATRLSAAAPVEAAGNQAVRPLTSGMADLVREGVRRSPLVRSQVARIEASDVILYLTEVFESEAGHPKGKLQFVSAAGGKRYLLVCLDRWKLGRTDRLVLLAHELQHAVEIADAPHVVDVPSFRALFHRIGWEAWAGRFETEAAGRIAARVRLELDRSRGARGTAGPSLPQAADENERNSRRNRNP